MVTALTLCLACPSEPVDHHCSTDACDNCQADTECDDGIHCTEDVCIDGRCVSTPNDLNCPEDAPFRFGENAAFFLVDERNECRDCCNPCRSQCELCGAVCPEQDLSEFPGFDAARVGLAARIVQWNCDWHFPFAAAGECSDGRLFLYENGGFVSQANFYDAETRAFLGLTTQTDCIDTLCEGHGYWPSPIACAGATVVEVLCGTLTAVGDELLLP